MAGRKLEGGYGLDGLRMRDDHREDQRDLLVSGGLINFLNSSKSSQDLGFSDEERVKDWELQEAEKEKKKAREEARKRAEKKLKLWEESEEEKKRKRFRKMSKAKQDLRRAELEAEARLVNERLERVKVEATEKKAREKLRKAKEEAEIRRAMKRMNVEDDDNEGPPWLFGGESTDEASDGELDGLENDQLVSAVAWDNVKRSRWLRGAEWVGDSPVDVVRPRLDKKEAGGLKRSYTMQI